MAMCVEDVFALTLPMTLTQNGGRATLSAVKEHVSYHCQPSMSSQEPK